ncbi:VanZ family protein [Nostoc ellipsosporum NOK]|nr:VanZ family protein [Nostoc ellipsosporum NOK]
MKLHKIFTPTSNFWNKVILIRKFVLLKFSIVVVLIATLYPFNFYLTNSLSIQTVIASFDNSSSFQDVVNNILLFIPLGFALTALLQKTKIKPLSKFLTVILFSAGLSLTVENLQMFLPSRLPTPADIANNTLGGSVGMICFYVWHSQSFIDILSSVKNSRISNSVKKITFLYLLYISLSFLILIPWQNSIKFSNWNLNYPLLLGNEQTGDKPWQGYISKVHIADKAVSQDEVLELFNAKNSLDVIRGSLVASYELTNQNSYQDLTGQLPELLPQGQLTNSEDGKHVTFSSRYWLKTEKSPIFLSKSIRQSSEFTIITTVATADTNQTGPARIISLSSGILRRNFTLGQQGTNLDLRIRTPISGENGTDIIFSVPEIFTNTKFHEIVITYSPANIQVYVDNSHNFYTANLLELIPQEQKLFYYALTFIPLGFCLTFLALLARRKLNLYRFLLTSGILLPSLILESILVIDTGKDISLSNILLGIFLTGGVMLMLQLRASVLVKKAA